MLVVPPAPPTEETGPTDATELAVGRHLDMTAALLTEEVTYVAHQVDVLYLRVPEGLVGGQLCVWEPEAVGEQPARTWVPPPDEMLAPEENLHVSFRGDAKHGVRRWTHGTDDARAARGADASRVSLVLEQYVISDDVYPRAVTFEIMGQGVEQ